MHRTETETVDAYALLVHNAHFAGGLVLQLPSPPPADRLERYAAPESRMLFDDDGRTVLRIDGIPATRGALLGWFAKSQRPRATLVSCPDQYGLITDANFTAA